jgi:hypothetical protein
MEEEWRWYETMLEEQMDGCGLLLGELQRPSDVKATPLAPRRPSRCRTSTPGSFDPPLNRHAGCNQPDVPYPYLEIKWSNKVDSPAGRTKLAVKPSPEIELCIASSSVVMLQQQPIGKSIATTVETCP